MTEPSLAFAADIGRAAEIDTLVHLGAGGGDPSTWAGLPARQVAFVLPAPLVTPALRKLAAGKGRVALHPVAVGARTGTSAFRQFNFAALSSLRDPAPALKELFPNLRTQAQPEVEVLAFEALVARLEPEAGRTHLLVIDMPGAEPEVVQALVAPEPAARFDHVILRAGLEPMYEGALSFAELVAALEQGGFRLQRQDAEDPDFPVAHLRFEPLIVELRAEQAARRAAEERAAEASKLRGDIDARKAERDEARARAKALEERIATLEAERDKAARAAEERAEEQAEATKKLRGDIDARKAERDEARAQAKALEERVATLKAEQEKHRDQLRKRDETVKEQAGAFKALQARHGELEAELKRMQARQRAVEDELNRAEAQMEIIRDLVRLPGGRAG